MATDAQQRAARTSRISARRQLTLPLDALGAAGLAPGDIVAVESAGDGRLLLTRIDVLVDRHSGSLSTAGSLRDDVLALRDEW